MSLLEEGLAVPFEKAPLHLNRQRAASIAALGMIYAKEGKIQTAAEHRPPVSAAFPGGEGETEKRGGEVKDAGGSNREDAAGPQRKLPLPLKKICLDSPGAGRAFCPLWLIRTRSIWRPLKKKSWSATAVFFSPSTRQRLQMWQLPRPVRTRGLEELC